MLPDEQRIVDLMRSQSHNLESGRPGTRRRWFLLVDLTGRITLCLSVGAATAPGTGQADVLSDYVRTAAPPPAGFFATQTNRYSRIWLGLSKLYAELDRCTGQHTHGRAIGRVLDPR